MVTIEIVVIASAVMFSLLIVGFLKYKITVNRKFKPVEIKEAEELARLIIKRKYKGRDYMRLFYSDFVKEFPSFETYNYTYFLQCLNPKNRERKNPDLIESVLIFLDKPVIVEGSIRHSNYLKGL
ncbi:MAG: hypothetical protein VYB44_07240 [Bacteroidota bacterium]|nr:hypothetical protein [Bacteroidota bacterium]